MKRFRISHTFRILAVLVVLGIAVFPLYWMVVTALSSNADLFAEKPRLVPDFSLMSVFSDALAEGKVLGWLRNSLVVAIGTTVLSVGLGIPLGYALSRFSFRGRGLTTLAPRCCPRPSWSCRCSHSSAGTTCSTRSSA
jgi:multiple sugar transport system permease protein